jgi:rhamnose transport system substrate-binding protein
MTIDLLKAYPDVQGIYALTTATLSGAVEASLKEQAFEKIYLTDLGTPNAMRDYLKTGVSKDFGLWNPADLGCLSIYSAKMLLDGKLPLVFTKDSIDQYDF